MSADIILKSFPTSRIYSLRELTAGMDDYFVTEDEKLHFITQDIIVCLDDGMYWDDPTKSFKLMRFVELKIEEI